ncbi:MAG: polymer-forming cytoskeletal protein, partial [Chloroflexi bacterium]|nr:polymer-forming cytoskeletal protein [Chloroflexota bacterium]
FTLTFATPALAFDGRGGDRVVIKADEIINDDLYITANEIIFDGTVKGDLIAFARTITINGTVEGDLLAAGQVVIINGTVADDARIAGAALQLGENAVIGSDLLVGGASLEAKDGSVVEGELVFGSGQALLDGDVTGDVLGGTGALELNGSFGGNVEAYVDVTEDTKSAPPMSMYMTNIPISIPSVQPGLTISDTAKIKGNLKYTSTYDLPVPSEAVGGKVTRTAPQVSAQAQYVPPTSAQKVGTWALDMIRTMITMVLFGLLLGWLFPAFMKALPEKIKSQPWGSLGWGLIAWAAFFVGLLVIVLAMIFGGMLFGLLTLGGVSGTIIWIGILALFGFTVLFVLVTSYLTKIIVGDMMGKWILNRFNPSLAEHKVWPMVIGVTLLIFIVEMFSFPLLPIGFFGWLINFSVILCGLGALWIWGRETMQARKTA